jgi:hypothetical protein
LVRIATSVLPRSWLLALTTKLLLPSLARKTTSALPVMTADNV